MMQESQSLRDRDLNSCRIPGIASGGRYIRCNARNFLYANRAGGIITIVQNPERIPVGLSRFCIRARSAAGNDACFPGWFLPGTRVLNFYLGGIGHDTDLTEPPGIFTCSLRSFLQAVNRKAGSGIQCVVLFWFSGIYPCEGIWPWSACLMTPRYQILPGSGYIRSMDRVGSCNPEVQVLQERRLSRTRK